MGLGPRQSGPTPPDGSTRQDEATGQLADQSAPAGGLAGRPAGQATERGDSRPHPQPEAYLPQHAGALPLTSPATENEKVYFPNPIGDAIVIGPQPRLRSEPGDLPTERYTMPDTVLDGAYVPGLAIRGASLRGDEHRYYGTTRQDAMGIWRVADPHTHGFLICVADGVGSQPLSQVGSRNACSLLRAKVSPRVTHLLTGNEESELPGLWRDLVTGIAEEIAATATSMERDPKELSTTLVGALIEASPDSPDERRFVAFSVGDSGAFLLRGGAFHPLFADPHDSAITSTGTNALPTSVGQVLTSTGALATGDMLMLCTDGLSGPMRNSKVTERLVEWWGGQSTIPSLTEFGWQLGFRAKSYSDDRTAVCAWSLPS